MKIAVTWVPVDTWPGEPAKSRQRSQFSRKWQSTIDLLEFELLKVGARDIVIQAYFRREDLRLDGYLRAGSTPTAPGVIVTFKNRQGTDLSFPCDTFVFWQDNLLAIALALEALRKVERYGVTRHQEQYKGWANLPPAHEPGKMDPKDALVFLQLHCNGIALNAETFKAAYRAAAARLHPDNQETGNEHQFRILGDAKQAIMEAYGWQA